MACTRADLHRVSEVTVIPAAYVRSEVGSFMRIIHDVHDHNSFHYLSIIFYISHQEVVDRTEACTTWEHARS